MSTPSWIPDDIPRDTPSVARVYDYLIGGYHNFASDRKVAEGALALYPDFGRVMQANRAFLRRAVAFLAEQGIDQFLDLGSGIPTVGNVHEVAQSVNPAAHVVYVDNDPVAVSHSEALLRDNAQARAILADAGRPAEVLTSPDVQRLLDWSRPVAVLLLAFLHFLPDDAQAREVVETLRAALPTGGYLVITHYTAEGVDRATMAQVEALYAASAIMVKSRSHGEVATLFDGLELAEPGVVYTPLWRPEGSDDLFLDHPERAIAYAGVGRKP